MVDPDDVINVPKALIVYSMFSDAVSQLGIIMGMGSANER